MPTLQTNSARLFKSRELQLREAVLLAFCDAWPIERSRLRHASASDWQRLLPWLDTSGLALYFFDRMTQLGLCAMLPPEVLSRLQQNLVDNTARTEAMIAESNAIHRGFQEAALSYAVLKGFSLWPLCVPKLELRSQLDLDFLVAEQSAPTARRILEDRGYRLHAISGRSWEFKSNEPRSASLSELYRPTSQRCAELHIESVSAEQPSLLARTEARCFHGACMPMLAPVDLFLGQGLHLYKHVCSEFSRTAHLIEFRRHVIARRDDRTFWRELQSLAEHRPQASIALGVVTLLTGRVMGSFAPEALTSWTVDRLPLSARRWVEVYGRSSVLATFPGSKLYLLLQRELEWSGVPAKRSVRRALLPRRLPPAIAHAPVHEGLRARVRRNRTQIAFILFRLRFHLVEGARYCRESIRWRRHMKELAL